MDLSSQVGNGDCRVVVQICGHALCHEESYVDAAIEIARACGQKTIPVRDYRFGRPIDTEVKVY